MNPVYRTALALLALLGSGRCFAPTMHGGGRSTRLLAVSSSSNGEHHMTAAAAAVASIIFVSAGLSDAAMAVGLEEMHPPAAVTSFSHVLLAARSGGRAGGRAYRPSGGGRSSYRAPSSYGSRTTIVRPMIAPPPVVISPFGGGFGYGGYGLSPGGFGLGYGLGAMRGAGDEARDYRQESEIAQSKAELEQAKQKEAELEARVKALESSQKQEQ